MDREEGRMLWTRSRGAGGRAGGVRGAARMQREAEGVRD